MVKAGQDRRDLDARALTLPDRSVTYTYFHGKTFALPCLAKRSIDAVHAEGLDSSRTNSTFATFANGLERREFDKRLKTNATCETYLDAAQNSVNLCSVLPGRAFCH